MNRVLLNTNKNNSVIRFVQRPDVEFRISQKEIGRGASCIVYHAVASDHTEHLLKEYYPKHLELDRDSTGQIVVPANKADAYEQGRLRFCDGCERQKAIRLSNEGLKNFTCNVQGYYQANGTEYIDMTCFSGQTYDHVQEKSVYNLMLRMRTLAQVVGNYHKAGLLHLDIKPENIYVRPEGETIEDVMLFDFDSVTPMDELCATKALSCTKTWAAPEQLLPEKRKSICPATDLFAIGEIIFVQLFGRHSSSAERRSFVTKYDYDHNAPIFKDMNPKVFPLLDELLCHTICGVVGKRYQSADELIAILDEIIKIADPKAPYLKSGLPAVQDFFVGRENEIIEIHRLLNENNILFLNGIGGIGKSELAKHYAAEHKDNYDTIIFAPYISDVNMLLLDDNAIPLYNFAPYPEEKPEEYCARKLRKLRELCDERTLFIVDNLDREDDPDLNKLLDLGCKLLITTRMDFSDYGYGTQLYLEAMRNWDSILALFHKYYTKPLTTEENACVEQIIDLVAGHTMTVELLAKQMMAGRVTPEKMLAKLQDGGIAESGKEKVRSGKDGALSAQSTYAHIQTLFDLSELDDDEKYILSNLSLIPYTGIADNLFLDWCELCDYTIINYLIGIGLILKPTADTISLHPIISESTIASTAVPADMHTKFLANAKKWVSDANLRQLDSGALKSRADMVFGIAKRLLSCTIETEEVAAFLNRVPTVFWKYGKLTDAIDCRERALRIRLHLFGELNGDTAMSYFNLGRMYEEFGDYEVAEKHYSKALEIRQALYGEEHEDTASCYNALGVLYKEKELFDKAEDYEWKALRIRETLFGEKNEDVATSHNNLAVLYRVLNRFEESERHHLYALEIRKYLFGEMHESISGSFNNLGKLCEEWGKLNEAEEYLLKALEIRRYIFGDMHLSTATTYANLGDLHKKREEFGSAVFYYQRALEIRALLLGENHQKTMRIRKRIAKLPEGPTRFDMLQDRVRIIIQKVLEDCDGPRSTNFSNERCPDQIVAKICVSKANATKVYVDYLEVVKTKVQRQSPTTSDKTICVRAPIPIINGKQEHPRIVLVLESPQVSEFNPININNPVNGPACGATGDNINQYLPQMLETIVPDCKEGEIKNYDLVLVNAIQYQCSLGEPTDKYRDWIFWESWKHKEVRADFCNRMRDAVGCNKHECVVINCCTTGRNVRSNHDLVNIVLEDMGICFYESTHPSSWHFKKNRVIIKHK